MDLEEKTPSELKIQCLLALESLAFISAAKCYISTGDKSNLISLYNALVDLFNEHDKNFARIPKIVHEHKKSDNQLNPDFARTPKIVQMHKKSENQLNPDFGRTPKIVQMHKKSGQQPNNTYVTKPPKGTFVKSQFDFVDYSEDVEDDDSDTEDSLDGGRKGRPLAQFFNRHDQIIQKIDQLIRDAGGYEDPDQLRQILGHDYEQFIQIYPHIRVRIDTNIPSGMMTDTKGNACSSKGIHHSTAYGKIPHNETFERSQYRKRSNE